MSKNSRTVMFFKYVKDFVHDMRIELKSERTVETYRQSLNSFRQYLSEQYGKGVDAITIDFVSDKVIREYIGWVAQRNSVGTRNVRLAALKAYVKYAASKNVDLTSLQISLTDLKHKKVHPKRHNWLNKEQILLILEQPKPTKIGVRDRFIILFLFSTGARLNEMITVKVNDVITDGKHPYVRLLGKGDKPRIVPVPDDAFLENFRYYCEVFHAGGSLNTPLFYTKSRGFQGEMSEDNVQRILKKYGSAAQRTDTSMPPVHTHLIRHSYGAQLYRLGLSLPEIAKLLGHVDISTTEIYAETDVEMAAEAMNNMLGDQPARKWDMLSEDEKLKFLGLK